MAKFASDEAVKKSTGKTWDEWFSAINKTGGKNKTHKEIVAHLNDNYDVSGWWQQMITNVYEQQIGRREKHQMADGFQISKSKTLNSEISKLYKYFSDKRLRSNWLDDEINIRKSTKEKSIRADWMDGKTHLDIYFYEKGKNKSQVVINHTKLKSSKDAEKMKSYWDKNLNELKNHLSK